MSDKTGGPAFPIIGIREIHGQPMQHVLAGGMTLRDYFAAKAMQPLMREIYLNTSAIETAKEAYEMADVMLAERIK